MKFEQTTPPYNEARHGKPYVARMTFDDPKGAPRWGDWVGQPGEEGLLVLDGVFPGDVIMIGQRDHRTAHSIPEFHILLEDGDLLNVTKAQAYKHWHARQKSTVTPNQI